MNWDRLHFKWYLIKKTVQETEGLLENHLVYMTRDGHAGMSLGQKLIVLESKRPGVFEVMCKLSEVEIVRMALRTFIGETIKYKYTKPAGHYEDPETGQLVQLPEYNSAKKRQRESYKPIRWEPLMPGKKTSYTTMDASHLARAEAQWQGKELHLKGKEPAISIERIIAKTSSEQKKSGNWYIHSRTK
jgi:hypothetical protein